MQTSVRAASGRKGVVLEVHVPCALAVVHVLDATCVRGGCIQTTVHVTFPGRAAVFSETRVATQ